MPTFVTIKVTLPQANLITRTLEHRQLELKQKLTALKGSDHAAARAESMRITDLLSALQSM